MVEATEVPEPKKYVDTGQLGNDFTYLVGLGISRLWEEQPRTSSLKPNTPPSLEL